MTLRIQMVPPEVQALQKELRNHKELWETIQANTNTFEDVVATIADHFDIVMHGIYSEEDICKLCQILVNRLQDKRAVIITSMSDPRMKGALK